MFVSSISFFVIIIRYLFTFCWALFFNFYQIDPGPIRYGLLVSKFNKDSKNEYNLFFPYPGVGLANLKPCVGRLWNNRPKGQKACPLTRERIKCEPSTSTKSMERSAS
jgi:hypothetical protein